MCDYLMMNYSEKNSISPSYSSSRYFATNACERFHYRFNSNFCH